jgi:hypothetical protein
MAPMLEARRKRDKAGRIRDDVYQDKQYGFSLDMDEAWKVNIMKNEEKLRLVFVEKNYQVPSDYTETPDFTKVPRLAVYVDTTSMSVYAFIDSLLSETFENDQKKDIKKEFEILTLGESPEVKDIIPRGVNRTEIAGEKAMIWSAQAKYVKEVPVSASSAAAKRVYGNYGASIIGVKRGDRIYLFHMICEWPYFEDIQTEIMGIIGTLSWADSEG